MACGTGNASKMEKVNEIWHGGNEVFLHGLCVGVADKSRIARRDIKGRQLVSLALPFLAVARDQRTV